MTSDYIYFRCRVHFCTNTALLQSPSKDSKCQDVSVDRLCYSNINIARCYSKCRSKTVYMYPIMIILLSLNSSIPSFCLVQPEVLSFSFLFVLFVSEVKCFGIFVFSQNIIIAFCRLNLLFKYSNTNVISRCDHYFSDVRILIT